MAQTNQNASPLLGATRPPDMSIMPIKKPGEDAPIARIPESNINNQSSTKDGMPLLQTSPQITNPAHSQTVTADAVKTGPADLVENRVNSIINANSPLMQLAAARANDAANSRGLRNSSIAVGAAQNAVMDAAMPIASADSSATNQTSQFNASNEQQTNLQNATHSQRTSELNAAAENTAAQTNIENAMRTNLANLDVSSRAFLADLETRNKQLIQSSANAATLFNTFQQQAAAILTSPNLDKSGKDAAIANLQNMLKDSIAAQDAVASLNLYEAIFGADTSAEVGGGNATTGGGPATSAQQAWDAKYNQIQSWPQQETETTAAWQGRKANAIAALGPRPTGGNPAQPIFTDSQTYLGS